MSIYVFTSVTTNYIPKARVLAQTLKQHNPSVRFVMFIAEPIPDFASQAPDCFDEIVPINALDIPHRQQWVFKHSVVEICTAIKGYALQSVLKRPDCEAVFYIDPDIAVFAPLTPLLDMFATSSILLTPHMLHPEEAREAVLDNEICTLQHGVYNLGFIGVKNDAEGRTFADWWAARLEEFCYDDIPSGIFTDQRWIDLVPAFFSRYAIVRHPGCNVATWNLSHRMIEGDFTTGFTVNGQPLVFYHFSGFDSGAQLAMLSKYGAHMPAAFTLRDWYIKTCEENDLEHFANVPWTFSFLENGKPISTDQRKLFRERQDLQAQFADPFATADPSRSYYDWYLANVSTQGASLMRELLDRKQQELGDATPLQYFLDHSAEMLTMSPTPYFDCEYYLRTYPDIAKVGMHPYLHFLAYGHKEGRNPSAEFNTKYYIEYNKQWLRPGENPLMHFVTVGQTLGLRTNRLYHPQQDRSIIQQWRRVLNPDLPTVLMVGHFMDGGVGTHVRQLAAVLAGSCNVILLHPTYEREISLSVMNRPKLPHMHFHPQRQFDDLMGILHALNISHVHIHHLWGNEPYLRTLADKLDVPIALTLHDYYLLAPQPHLCDEEGMFVGDPIERAEETLVRNALTEEGASVVSLADWQAQHRWVIERSKLVIAPSHDVASRFKQFYPSLSIIVAPHFEKDDPGDVTVRPQPMGADEPLRVVITGTISPQKGLQTIVTCAVLADLAEAPIEFHLVGGFSVGTQIPSVSCLYDHGSYDNEQLTAILRRIRPHIAWLPSTCPETYSYVLSEAMRNGLPVATTDIGAFPERLAGRPWSWVAPWRQSAYEWLHFFHEVRRQHFIPGLAPHIEGAVASRGELSGDFYHQEYLGWIRSPAMAEEATAGGHTL